MREPHTSPQLSSLKQGVEASPQPAEKTAIVKAVSSRLAHDNAHRAGEVSAEQGDRPEHKSAAIVPVFEQDTHVTQLPNQSIRKQAWHDTEHRLHEGTGAESPSPVYEHQLPKLAAKHPAVGIITSPKFLTVDGNRESTRQYTPRTETEHQRAILSVDSEHDIDPSGLGIPGAESAVLNKRPAEYDFILQKATESTKLGVVSPGENDNMIDAELLDEPVEETGPRSAKTAITESLAVLPSFVNLEELFLAVNYPGERSDRTAVRPEYAADILVAEATRWQQEALLQLDQSSLVEVRQENDQPTASIAEQIVAYIAKPEYSMQESIPKIERLVTEAVKIAEAIVVQLDVDKSQAEQALPMEVILGRMKQVVSELLDELQLPADEQVIEKLVNTFLKDAAKLLEKPPMTAEQLQDQGTHEFKLTDWFNNFVRNAVATSPTTAQFAGRVALTP